MQSQKQDELFADLNPPKVIHGFLLGDGLVIMTEAFFTNHQLEVYNFETKVTSSELVLVPNPINRKNWHLGSICRDPRQNILISGMAVEGDVSQFQIFILRKLKKDPAKFSTNYGFHFSMIRNLQGFQQNSPIFAENCLINQTQSGDVYFLGPHHLFHSCFFKCKMEDLSTTNANAAGGGGLFGGLFAGAGTGQGGQGGGLLGDDRSKKISIPEKQFNKYVELERFPGQGFLGYCSTLVADGKLYVFGGENREKEVLSELWQFDTKTEKWTDLSPKDGKILKRTGAAMYFSAEFLYICGGRDSNQALCNNVIAYNTETDTWKVFKVNPSSEPINTCFSYANKLCIMRGRKIELAYDEQSKPYYQTSEGHNDGVQDNTLQDYRKLFSDMPYHDVLFKVEDQEIPAHRALLSIRCPHFLQVFPAGIKDPSNKIIEVPEMKANVFKGLLEYLYCGEIPQDENITVELLKASEIYQIEELREKCQEYLAFNLRIDNLANLTTLARSYKADELKNAVLKFIKANMSQLDVGDFNQFDKEFLVEIIMYKHENT